MDGTLTGISDPGQIGFKIIGKVQFKISNSFYKSIIFCLHSYISNILI